MTAPLTLLHRLVVSLIIAALMHYDANAEESNKVGLLRISPSGENVSETRQVVFEFNGEVAPLGRMERDQAEVPVTIEPTVECQWRWLSRNTLACQLGKGTELSLSTTYYLQLRAEPNDNEGKLVWNAIASYLKEHAPGGDPSRMKLCTTARPAVESVDFRSWRAPASPHLFVRFNQAVDQESVEHSLFFKSGDKRVKAKITAARDRVLELEPEEELARSSHAALVVEPGIVSKVGPERSLEAREVISFDTFGDFNLVGLRCCSKGAVQSNVQEYWDCNHGKAIDIKVGDELARCDPRSAMSLLFSAPVISEEVKKGLTINPALDGGREDYDPWETISSYSRLEEPFKIGKLYSVELPLGLKARQRYHLSADTDAIKDEFGRPLTSAISFDFETEDRAPRMALPSQVGVLEEQVITHLPVAVQNLDSISLDYSTLTPLGEVGSQRRDTKVDNIPNLSYYFPIKVRELLGATTGVMTGTLSSSPPTERGKPLFAQVTPYHVHVKLGHHNSLVWVTNLESGAPVIGAKVSLFVERADLYRSLWTPLSEGITDEDGVAIIKGTSVVDPGLQYDYKGWPSSDPIIKVRVDHQDKLAILPLLDDFKLYPHGEGERWIESDSRKAYGHLKAWGTTPQGVYRLGQTVQYKIYVRQHGIRRAELPPLTGYSLTVLDPLGKVVHSIKNITLNPYGGVDGEFVVPETGAMGIYQFRLTANFAEEEYSTGPLVLTPLDVLISDFTPAAFRVTAQLDKKLYRDNDSVKIATDATLHAGGPYSSAPLRIVAKAFCRPLDKLDAKVASFRFDICEDEASALIWEGEGTLDAKGHGEQEFKISDLPISHGVLSVESAVSDDRGGKIATTATADVVSRDRFVGIRSPQWTYDVKRPARLEMAVVNELGKVSQGDPIAGKVTREVTKAARVKGAGDAYLTHYETEEVEVAQCDIAGTKGIESCVFIPEHPGQYRLTATTTDTRGESHTTTESIWVVGPGEVVWRRENNNQLDIIPEKREYKLGQTARFLVKNPFPEATALVSLERYGVMKQWVQKLKGSAPIIDVKITEDLLPGFYLSVVVTSPRVSKEIKEGSIDLGKPTMRMGYAAVEVIDDANRLTGTVKSTKPTYRPGEVASISIDVPGKEEVEVAVAVLDEAVFDLIKRGIDYFDPYKGFFSLEPLDVTNFNLLLELVGLRNFHKKGANSGGDGGGFAFRTVTKFVAYWNPSVSLDEKRRATVSFDVPDNLTGWRVLALLMSKGDKMGLAEGSFKTNRPLEIRAALPNFVFKGDSFKADFTVLNRQEQAVDLPVSLEVQGGAENEGPTTERVHADPFQRVVVSKEVKATKEGVIKFRVRAGEGAVSDALSVDLPVKELSVKETVVDVARVEGERLRLPYELPEGLKGAHSQSSLSPTILSSLDGPLRSLKDYPYSCWEQSLTRTIGASIYKELEQRVGDTISWSDATTFIVSSLQKAAGFQAPNGGMTFYVPRDENADPYLSAYTALAFIWLRDAGISLPPDVEEKLVQYLQRYLRENISSTFYTAGMAATTRAVALAALTARGVLTKDDVVRHMEFAPQMTLFGKAHLLRALVSFSDTEIHQRALVETLLAHAHEESGKTFFQEPLDLSSYRVMLGSTARDSCAVLSAFLKSKREIRPSTEFLLKVVRGVSDSRRGGAWSNTQENVFCVNALLDYAKEYEVLPPRGEWELNADETKLGVASFSSFSDPQLNVSHEYDVDGANRKGEITVERRGEGAAYLTHRLGLVYEKGAAAANNGIDISRRYEVKRDGEWRTLDTPYVVKRGELVRITLHVSLPAPRNYVVISDAVPAGLEPVNRDLATASLSDADEGDGQEVESLRGERWIEFGASRWSFYHRELKHDSVRFYSEQLSPGNYRMSYVAQAITEGEFKVPPVFGEEMYEPEVFGRSSEAVIRVGK